MYLFGCLLLVLSPGCVSFNLDTESPTLYSGPRGSYFGYSVDFYSPDHRTVNVLVGAPKANTSQPGIVEGGAVYYCKWPAGGTTCTEIPFDKSSNRKIKITQEPVEFKSNQWFGATVRSYNEKVVACAPLYHWRALKVTQEKDPVGTCYVAVQNFSTYAEYSPCRSDNADPEGQGVCQAGFSLDFTQDGNLVLGGPGSFYWQGQVFTAGVVEILDGYDFRALIRKVKGERQTGVAPAEYDDSFLGYSVAVGEFTGDSEQEFVAGIPRGAQAFGYVAILNATDMTYILNFTGEQMASYFGYTVAVSDINRDGLDDVLVGAPLFMDRESDGKLKEVGQVYLFLQEEAFQFQDPQKLLGTDVFGRYGSAIASLADLNHDGYNDIAIGVPFAGDDGRGKVLIYNGQSTGLNPKPSQVLEEQWSSQAIPSGFGFTLRGASDIDRNDYPDLIVGAFGASKVVVYRARPVVTVHAQLQLNPSIINPENKSCILPESESLVSCFTVEVCATISGHAIPYIVVLNVDLHLDKLKKKGVVERILFLYYHQPQHSFQLVVGKSQHSRCKEFVVYLTDEKEFRDKLTPIGVNLNYSLDESRPLEGLAVKPILNYYSDTFLQKQAHILLDCGDDNLCIPMLKLSASPDRQQLIIGDEIPLTLIINAKNEGEGAYEAELYVTIPPESDYIGVIRNNEALSKLSCAYKVDNSTQMVVCDLGNPMVAGTNLSVGLRFSVQRLEKADASIRFDLQIKSSNKDNPDSNTVQLQIDITAVAHVNVWGVSHPEQIVLPMTNWESKDKPKKEEDVGPLVQHVYELHNSGPSTISDAVMEVGWPSRYREEYLLYILQIQTDGPLYCWINATINPLQLETIDLPAAGEHISLRDPSTISHLITRREVRLPQPLKRDPTKILNCSNIECTKIYCRVGQLEKRQSAVLKVRSRLWIQTFLKRRNDHYSLHSLVSFAVKEMPYNIQQEELSSAHTAIRTAVIWATPDASLSIPLWVIILAVLVGLLVLAILILVMWKFGFFDRARPPQDDMTDREQLNPEKATEA
ncbi:integrin alpha-8 [Callorhinchus milii]|uniref:integrin alpha-8 n=1 Tax=Callorhinchus milii TaxID=7868 RepID=UPI000457488A|nr:integrin alpha-8 [Callorhinchus milii]|eukprot:gi/632976076/ref/XP_007904592.1/ PREDICTED: integrin alpha-8 [Callorhinchus milii]